MQLTHQHIAEYATKRNLPPSEARMLDNLRFRGEHPFSTIEEVHGFYEILRIIVAPENVRPLPDRSYSYDWDSGQAGSAV